MKILLVDDHEIHRKVLGARLRKKGYGVGEATDGIEALAALEKGKYDVVISDVLMPRMDGYEFCNTVRKKANIAHIPIALYSAIYTSQDDEETAKGAGADLFFRKPIREEEITEALRGLIAARKKRKSQKPRGRRSKVVLKEYSARLVQKLEETVDDLERKTGEVERSEKLFKTLVTTVPAAAFIYRSDKILYANPAASALGGWRQDELLSMNPLDIIMTEDRDLARRRLFMGSGMVTSRSRIEIRMTTQSGAVRWLDFSAGRIDHEGGEAVIGTAFDITDRKKAEHELKDSEERYRELVVNSLGLICVHDIGGKLLMVNPAASSKLGYTQSEMVGTSLVDYLAASIKPLFKKYLERIQEHGSDSGIMYVTTRSGAPRTWLYHNVMSDKFGSSKVVLGFAMDVTDRLTMEETLRDSQERLKAIISAEPECVKITDGEGTVVQMNPAGLAMIDAEDESKIVGHSVYSLLMENDRDRFKDLTKKVCSGKRGKLEYQILSLKGHKRWMETHAVPLKDKSKGVTLMLSVTRDITERKHAEEQLANQAALLDVDPAAIFVLDTNGIVQFWNRSAERIYGRPKAKVVGKSFSSILRDGSQSRFDEIRSLVLNSGDWEGEWTHRCEDGREVIVESHWVLMRDNGKPKSIYVVDSDITEKKKLEAQFLRSQRMENLGMVSGGIAHDLNNILGPILLSLELIRKQVTDQRITKFLDMIETSARRGSAIVKQILSFARGKEGERSVLQLGYLIGEVEQFVHQTFPRSIQVSTVVPRNVWSVNGNATHLHQVLLNLCVNARDAMTNGGRLTISCENEVVDEHHIVFRPNIKQGPYVVLTVADTGEGIPAELQPRIFEPFFSTKEVEKGTGLGLSTVAGIVQNYGGFVDVYSEPGKGSSFKVYLPAVQSEETLEAQKEKKKLPTGRMETILIVEDELAIREITKETLESYGYKTISAIHGAEALELYKKDKSRIDLVLCDMSMPEMDGLATIKALRHENADVKVVAVSGFAESELLARDFRETVKAFIQKPYSAERLLETVNTVFKGST